MTDYVFMIIYVGYFVTDLHLLAGCQGFSLRICSVGMVVANKDHN